MALTFVGVQMWIGQRPIEEEYGDAKPPQTRITPKKERPTQDR
jgi:hypothetical protein